MALNLLSLPAISKAVTSNGLPISYSDIIRQMCIRDRNGIQHTEAVMYRTVSNDFTPDEEVDYDMVVFFSPAGVTSLKKNFPDFDQKEIKIWRQ